MGMSSEQGECTGGATGCGWSAYGSSSRSFQFISGRAGEKDKTLALFRGLAFLQWALKVPGGLLGTCRVLWRLMSP